MKTFNDIVSIIESGTDNIQSIDSESIKNFNLDDYKKYLDSLYKKEFNNFKFYMFDKINLTDFFALIERISKEHKYPNLIEAIHYELILYILKEGKEGKKYFKEPKYKHLFSLSVEAFSRNVSKELLNSYDIVNNESILSLIIPYYDNYFLLPTLIKNGLIVDNINGVHVFYYLLNTFRNESLINKGILNVQLQYLIGLNITPPPKCWTNVFKMVCLATFDCHQVITLLKIKEKEFIVDEKTKECIWHLIIKNDIHDYQLPKYIPPEFYKPYVLNNNNIVDYLILYKNISFAAFVKNDIYLLLEKKEDVYRYWNFIIDDFTLNTPEKIEKYKKDEQNSHCPKNYRDKYLIFILEALFSFNKKEFSFFNNKKFLNIKKQLNNAKKNNSNFDISKNTPTFPLASGIEEQIKNYLLQANTEEMDKILSLLLDFITSLIDNEKSINDNNPSENIEKKDDLTSIIQDLYTTESLNSFLNEFESSDHDDIKKYNIKFNENKTYKKHKSLVTASTLLANLDNLYETFPHFSEVIKHIENIMVLQNKGNKSFYIPPLLLGGGPGVGKTFFCHTLSQFVNTHFEMLNMESVSANFIITGGSGAWKGGEPGVIFRVLMENEKNVLNPIILLDELEKAQGSSQYNPINCLLPLLEKYTASKFKDECVPLAIDASQIVWFATANDLDKLSAPIKSRFDIFNIPNPTPSQRKALIKGVYASIIKNNSWGAFFETELPDETLNALANLMTPGAARDLRRSITVACSKAVREESKTLLPKHIEEYKISEIMPWDEPI